LNELTRAEIDRRLPVWEAMADLFLDTAYLDIAGPKQVAERVRPAGFSPAELRSIFRDEVGPGFSFNGLEVAGEWAGWDRDFVRDRVTSMLSSRWKRLTGQLQYLLVGRLVYCDWLKVEAELERSC
jgi:hypothetical protein